MIWIQHLWLCQRCSASRFWVKKNIFNRKNMFTLNCNYKLYQQTILRLWATYNASVVKNLQHNYVIAGRAFFTNNIFFYVDKNTLGYLNASMYIHSCEWSKHGLVDPILRLLNLQLQRQSCSRLERFFKVEESILVIKMH
jgi:hypothetical protein